MKITQNHLHKYLFTSSHRANKLRAGNHLVWDSHSGYSLGCKIPCAGKSHFTSFLLEITLYGQSLKQVCHGWKLHQVLFVYLNRKHTCLNKEGLISLYTIDIIFGIGFSELFRITEDDIYDSYIHNFLLLNVFLFDNPLYEKYIIIIETNHVTF